MDKWTIKRWASCLHIKPKNQRLIAVSIDGEQASPSLVQAKQLRELDQAGKLNGDVIDGIFKRKEKGGSLRDYFDG